MLTKNAKAKYIKFLYLVVIVTLLLPINVQAKNNEKIIFEKVPDIEIKEVAPPVKTISPPPVAKRATAGLGRIRSSIPGNWGGQCVPFAKWYLGVGGTWGYGGRYLSNNSKALVGTAILFGNYHVGVVIAVNATQVMVVDSNKHLNERVSVYWLNRDDPTIRGYHQF